MKFIIENIQTTVVIGGSDNLLDFDIMKKLRAYLRIRVDGYQHSEKYQEGVWDGYKYFISKKGQFATGFLPLVAKYLKSLGVKLSVEDKRTNMPILREELDDFIGCIDGETWIGREMQVNMVAKINKYITIGDQKLYFPRGILDAATNAGKNSMSALVINNLAEKYDTIFMVSNRTIYKQAVEFFSQVIDEPVGEVKSGKYNPKWFTVCMVKTLYNRASKDSTTRKWLNETKVVIVDESDESGATEYSKTLTFIGAAMRIFVSGTPLEASATNNMVSIGLSGPVLGKITNKDLVDAGYSQKPYVKIVLNNTRVPKFTRYNDEVYKTIHTSINRVKLIQEILERHDDKYVLVTFIEKVHGYFMYNYLKDALPNIDMGIVHGTSKARESTIDDFKKGKISVLFASMILKRGANIPRIEVVVMAQGGKSIITVKQIAGRGMRHDGKSDSVLMYDFYDVGQYVGKHSRDRIRIYKNEEFDVEELYNHRRGKPIDI